MSRSQLESMTVPQLKDHLRSRNLKVGGRKVELVDRLLAPAPVVTAVTKAAPVTKTPITVHYSAGLPPMTYLPQAKAPRAPRVARSPKKPKAKKAKSPGRSPGRSPKKVSLGRNFRADLDTLNVPVLKALLKAKKQKVSGRKEELVARIVFLARGKNRVEALDMLTIPALKAILKSRYQKVGGKKADLIARIVTGEGAGTQKPRAQSPRAKPAKK